MTSPLSLVIVRRETYPAGSRAKLTQLVRLPTSAELRDHGLRFRCVPDPLRLTRCFPARWCEVVSRADEIVRVIDLFVAQKEYGRHALNPATTPQQVPKAAREVHVSALYTVEIRT